MTGSRRGRPGSERVGGGRRERTRAGCGCFSMSFEGRVCSVLPSIRHAPALVC